MRKEKFTDGSIWYTTDAGKVYKMSAALVARQGGEAAADRAMSYTPSPYAHPDEYKYLYDQKAGEEN